MSQGRLCPEALRLAKSVSLEDLYRKTELPLSWLRKFRQGEIKSPSVQRVEALLLAFGVKRVDIAPKEFTGGL